MSLLTFSTGDAETTHRNLIKKLECILWVRTLL